MTPTPSPIAAPASCRFSRRRRPRPPPTDSLDGGGRTRRPPTLQTAEAARPGRLPTQGLRDPPIFRSAPAWDCRRRRTVGVNSDGRRLIPSMRRCPILMRLRVRQQGTPPFLFVHQRRLHRPRSFSAPPLQSTHFPLLAVAAHQRQLLCLPQ